MRTDITIARRAVRASIARRSDFIQQYIFPGGMLASPSRFASGARAGGFDIAGTLTFGSDYAKTLSTGCRLRHPSRRGSRTGFDERFIRGWRFYLAYCTAGFDSGGDRCRTVHARRALIVDFAPVRREHRGRRTVHRSDGQPSGRRRAPASDERRGACARPAATRWRGAMTFLGLSIYDGWFWGTDHAWAADQVFALDLHYRASN